MSGNATIEAVGEKDYPKAAIKTDKNVTITGEGLLTLRSIDDCGIYAVNNACVTLSDANLDVSGEWALAGDRGSGERLVIIRSKVKAVSRSDEGACCDFNGGITFDGCEIVSPEGGKMAGGTIVDAGGTPAKEVEIDISKFGLWICGTQVTGKNHEDILGDGKFSYDIANKTLTVKNGYTTSNNVITSYINGLTINTKKDLILGKRTGEPCISLYGNTTFSGSGNLKVIGNVIAGDGQNNVTVTVDHTKLYVSGSIVGNGKEYADLSVINSSVTVNNTNSEAIANFRNLLLSDVSIVEPEGARVVNGTIVDSNGAVATKVIIEPYNPADVNRDGTVDSADIVAVIKEMPDGDMKADVNGDETIDSADIVAVIKAMK